MTVNVNDKKLEELRGEAECIRQEFYAVVAKGGDGRALVKRYEAVQREITRRVAG